MAGAEHFWTILAFALNLGGGACCVLAIAWIVKKGDRSRADRLPIVGALGLTATWCVVHAALGPTSVITSAVEIARNLAWIAAIYRLFANDGRHESQKLVRPVILALVFVEVLQLALIGIAARYALTPELSLLLQQVVALFRVLVAVAALVLLHNLYVGASRSVRRALRWTTAAFAALWAFDLNVHFFAYMSGGAAIELSAVRGLVIAIACIPIAIGSVEAAASMRFRPSRKVAFQTLSLLIIAAYLLAMVLVAQSLTLLGGELGRLLQVGFTFAASVVALLWLPSQHLRGWLRVTAIKHLFQHRYDYRAEWLRFTQTIGQGDESNQSLHQRAIKAMADITGSEKGLLLLKDDHGSLELAARWHWRDIDVPAGSFERELVDQLETEAFVFDIDELRGGSDGRNEKPTLPRWLLTDQQAWAMVPLLHFERLTGIIVLARPADTRNLDWEDFDLLRVVGQQLASYLAEQSGQQALMDAARFDEFNRRIAFVMHDIKNLASQLSLLTRNAERHADNPAFREDMLVTLRKSSEKLNTLLARLNRYGPTGTDAKMAVDLLDIAMRVTKRFRRSANVSVIERQSVPVLADPENLEQALVHLVQNAIDASDAEQPVYLNVMLEGVTGRIEILDSGCGMSAEFVRNGLFKPFVSSKVSGFGIGAFESRELIRAMGGRLDVESREGLGTRFSIAFPVARQVVLEGAADPLETEVA